MDIPAMEQALTRTALTYLRRSVLHLTLCDAYLALPLPEVLKALEHAESGLRLAGLLQAKSLSMTARALVCLARCQAALRRWPQAVDAVRRFQGLRPHVGSAGDLLEAEAMLCLGLTLGHLGRRRSGCTALRAAVTLFERSGQGGRAERCRQHLVRAYLDMGDPTLAEPLLAAGRGYAAAHPDDITARLTGMLAEAEWHLLSGRVHEARRCAYDALKQAPVGGSPVRCQSYLLLAQCAGRIDEPEAALNFALSARITALEAGDHHWGFEATQRLIELYQSLGDQGPVMLANIHDLYRPHGLDIFAFFPEGL